MALKSSILSGSQRLEVAATGGASIKRLPPPDDIDAVRRIQKALVALGIPLPLSFPNGPNQDPDGKFGNETYQAVLAFQQRAFPTVRNEWDGRVGQKTLAKMDEALPLPSPVPVSKKLIADIVVRFQGAFSEGVLEPDVVLRTFLVQIYKTMPDQPFGSKVLLNPFNGRTLLRVGRKTTTIGSASQPVFSLIINELRNLLNALNADPGKIFIHGSSSGGRNAIDFAAHMSLIGFKPHFVAAVDAAFFQADTTSRPEANIDRPITIPIFSLSSGMTLNRHNFFQTLGNHAKRSLFHGVLFTSKMAGEEIHGRVTGFQDHDLTRLLPRPLLLSDDDAHIECGRLAIPEAMRLIADDLLLNT